MTKNIHQQPQQAPQTNNDCFIIMPIADHPDYKNGHFKRVYEDIFAPACIAAGYKPVRADDVTQANLIHLDILQKLLESPMAICDLSTRNPNVLFELGLRQAFDKPTILVQEIGTPKIFDINMFRYTEYRNGLDYRDVLSDQKSIQKVLEETTSAVNEGKSVNSIIKLLSITSPATLQDSSTFEEKEFFNILRSDINSLKEAIFSKQPNSFRAHNSRTQNKNLKNEINKLSFHKFITLGKDTFGHNLDKFIQMITITFDVKDIHISKDKLDRPYIAITTYQDISDELLFEISQHADVKIEDIDDLPF